MTRQDICAYTATDRRGWGKTPNNQQRVKASPVRDRIVWLNLGRNIWVHNAPDRESLIANPSRFKRAIYGLIQFIKCNCGAGRPLR